MKPKEGDELRLFIVFGLFTDQVRKDASLLSDSTDLTFRSAKDFSGSEKQLAALMAKLIVFKVNTGICNFLGSKVSGTRMY